MMPQQLNLRPGACLEPVRGSTEKLECLTVALLGNCAGMPQPGEHPMLPARHPLLQRLLAGERCDAEQLGYRIEGTWHLALVLGGPRAATAITAFARQHDLEHLQVQNTGQRLWAWLGSARAISSAAIKHWALALEDRISVAIGEPCPDFAGWRESHAMALSADRIGQLREEQVTRFSDFPLEAAALSAPQAAGALRQRYLLPLDLLQIGSAAAQQTLSAFIECEHCISSTAASLRLSRRTVERRLAAIEQAIGKPLKECMPEITVALRLQRLGVFADPASADPALALQLCR